MRVNARRSRLAVSAAVFALFARAAPVQAEELDEDGEAPAGEERASGWRTAGWIAIGAGAAGVAVGAFYAQRAMQAAVDAEAAEKAGVEYHPVGARIDADGRAAAERQAIAWTFGGLALATGLVLFWLEPEADAEASAGGLRVRF